MADLYRDIPMTGPQYPGFTNDPIHVNGIAYDASDDGLIVCSQRSGVIKLHSDGTLAWFLAPHLTRYIDDADGDGVLVGKDGRGFISKINADGTVAQRRWAVGLDRPKGSVVVGRTVWVTDIDVLVAIDRRTGKVRDRYPAPGATFLNDVVRAPDGRLFISDTFGNAIFEFSDGRVRNWLRGHGLAGPNGLTVIGGDLVVGELGRSAPGVTELSQDDLKPHGAGEVGTVKKVDLTTKEVSPFGDGAPIGSVDGVTPTGTGGVYVTDFGGGRLLSVTPGAPAVLLATTRPGLADVLYRERDREFVLVQMVEGEVAAGRS